jgi:hypothetical protein
MFYPIERDHRSRHSSCQVRSALYKGQEEHQVWPRRSCGKDASRRLALACHMYVPFILLPIFLAHIHQTIFSFSDPLSGMMPEQERYGPWPASGEIDIAEMRGNDWTYSLGRDVITSTLHWGPTSKLNAYWMTYGHKFLRRKDFTNGFHTYGLEWSEDYLFTYLDSRLKQVFYMKFQGKQDMWQRGHFDGQVDNSTVIANPWKQTGRTNTPFDENFYLILNVAVGSQVSVPEER